MPNESLFRRMPDALRRWWHRPCEPSARHIPELNGLRVLLVFIVSWYHFWQQSWLTPHVGDYSLDFLVRAGYVPVDGTILLSGFLLFLPHARAMLLGDKKPEVRTFYQRRVMRIVPSYYFVTLVMLLAIALPGFWSNGNASYANQLIWLPRQEVQQALEEKAILTEESSGEPTWAHDAWQGWMDGKQRWVQAAYPYDPYAWRNWQATRKQEMNNCFCEPEQYFASWEAKQVVKQLKTCSADLTADLYLAAWPAWKGVTPNGPVMSFDERLQWISDTYQGDAGRYLSDWADNLPAAFYGNEAQMKEDVLRHLTFTQTFDYASYIATPIGVASWTIAIEMQAYLLFPLLAWLARKNPLATFGFMIAAALGFRSWCLWTMTDYNMVVNQLANFLDVYAIGMASALLYVKLTTLWPKRGDLRLLLNAAATIVLLLALYGLVVLLQAQAGTPGSALQAGQMMRRPLFALLLAAVAVALPFALRPVRFLFGNRLMGFLAMVSMNYYLFHQNIAVFLKNRLQLPAAANYPTPNMAPGGPEQPWASEYMALCFLGSLLVAALVTFLVEKPCAWLLGKGLGKLNSLRDSQMRHAQKEKTNETDNQSSKD